MIVRGRGGDLNDLFSINPLKRSFWIVFVSWMMLIVPATMLSGDLRAIILISSAWLAITGIIMVTPILIWCLIEEAWNSVSRRVNPSIEQLDLSPRAFNLLRRHGFVSISSVEATPDSSLMLLSNMDARALREIRRSISLWRYRRWQERGFPADEMP